MGEGTLIGAVEAAGAAEVVFEEVAGCAGGGVATKGGGEGVEAACGQVQGGVSDVP